MIRIRKQVLKMTTASATLSKTIRYKFTELMQIWNRTCRRKYSKYYDLGPLTSKYGGKTNVTVLPGIGIGPEIMECTLEVLTAAEAPLSYEIKTIRPDHEDDDYKDILSSIKRNRVAIKANIETTSKNPLAESRNVSLRKLLDLYVYVLPLKSFPGIPTRFGELDLVMIRQNSEGEYLMLEHEPVQGSVECLKVVTRYNTRRLAEYAYEYAVRHRRKRMTVIHTADIHPLTEGLFLDVALEVSQDYPDIETNVQQAGRMILDVMKDPRQYDVVLATNLNGGIVSNVLNGMLGGPALSAGINLNGEGLAVFEPGIRNKGSGIVGKGVANPTAMLMAASSMLSYLGHEKIAHAISYATSRSILVDRVLTQELGGKATTREVTDNVIRHVKELMEPDLQNQRPGKAKHKRWNVEELERHKREASTKTSNEDRDRGGSR